MNITRLLLKHSAGVAVSHVKSSGAVASRTYRELSTNIHALGGALGQLGVRDRDRVLILAGTVPEALEAILGVLNVGADALPVSPLLGAHAIEVIIERMRPACCIFEEPPKPAIEAALGRCGSRLVSLRPPPPSRGDWHDYRMLLANANPTGTADFPDTHPALTLHTSGSEGHPKAIAMTHGALRVFLEHNAIHHAQFRTSDDADPARYPVVSVLPLSHLGGLSACLHGLMTGGSTWLMSYFLPEAYLRLLETTGCHMTILVPSMYRALLQHPDLTHANLSRVRYCLTLGEPCPEEFAVQIAKAFGATVVSAYGMTECLTGLGHAREDLLRGRVKPGSCGSHMFGELRLVDEHGRDHPNLGELWVRNPTVRPCYLDRELNETRFVDGWFRTRDVFLRDEDGQFFHRGRCDDMFICNGKNVYPVEIETLLLNHPAVEVACVAPVRNRHQETVTGALIRARHATSPQQIMEFCARNGPSHAVPQIVRLIADLPQIGPGKIDRVTCRELLQRDFDAVPGLAQ